RWLRPLELLLTPLAAPIDSLRDRIARMVPALGTQEEQRIAELAVEEVIVQGEEAGSIPQDHARMLKSVLEFKNTVAREVMVPRTQIVAIEIDTSLEDVLKLVEEKGHSRYPVFKQKVDQVEGVLYAKDLFRTLMDPTAATQTHLEQIIRKPVFFA